MELEKKTNGTPVSTLIFMDLETTGLPCDVGKKNVHITEMAFIAIDRSSFEDDQTLRVINKLSLCVRPRSIVSPDAMYVTGLYNDVLENQEEFDDSVPKLLEYFFRRLQPPLCLLAHNGTKFDFPVLQAELKRINYSLASDILCADTLTAFRSICLSPKPANYTEHLKQPEKEEIYSQQILLSSGKDSKPLETVEKEMQFKQMKSNEKDSMTEDDIEVLLSQDLEIFISMEEISMPQNQKVLQSCNVGSSITSDKCNVDKNESEFLDPVENEKTPTSRKIPQNFDPSANNVRKRKVSDPMYTPKKEYNREVRPVKRTLFSESDPRPKKITKFNLESLYHHFFNEKPPNSHYAEVDCVSLSKVCQKMNKDFLSWIDENSIPFSSVDALW